MAPASHGLLGRIQRANDVAAHRFGPHTAEVEAFIAAAGQLTPWQWRQVLATRRLVAAVSKDGASSTDSARSIQAAIRSSDTRISEPMARAGEVLFDTLAKKSDDKQVAAWQAMTALIMRSHLPALKFAVHYAPFAALVPLSGSDALDPKTTRFIALLETLDRDRLLALGKRWRIDPSASRALLQAVAKHRHAVSEESVAIAALCFVPNHLEGDEGWSAVRTAVHGGRVLGALAELTPEETTQLWAPLEAVIPLASLAVENGAVVEPAKKPPRVRTAASATKTAAAYGPNHAEVAGFIKGVQELSPIQWLRVLDRRKLVASVAREGAVEPAGMVRSLLIALDRTRDLDTYTRCRIFAAVHEAGISRWNGDADLAQLERVAVLDRAEWERMAESAPPTNVEALAPLVNAGTALIDFFGGRSDDEAVATWHAVSALVHRHQLPPIKFAASYAPLASAIPVTNPRSLGAMVSRYVTAVGRLGAPQCAALAKPWQLEDELSNALSRAVA
ncbi:MAG TPA: hypothetical protein VJR46_13420, partial [Candidatus Dormibacteraeota bacterium]|nr:hypothetical protein [Candidatus Dormibacteraeota bacterium]